MKMPEAMKGHWKRELRKNQGRQTKYTFFDQGDNTVCAVGLLAEAVFHERFPQVIGNKLISDFNLTAVYQANDAGKSFAWIANNLDGLMECSSYEEFKQKQKNKPLRNTQLRDQILQIKISAHRAEMKKYIQEEEEPQKQYVYVLANH